jgi:hypothetical protein
MPHTIFLQVFQDIGEDYVIDEDFVHRGHFLGKGAFGAVFAGTMTHKVRLILITNPENEHLICTLTADHRAAGQHSHQNAPTCAT